MPLNIYTHPDYASQKDLILSLVQGFHNEGQLLVKGSRNIIKTNTLGSEKVNIKYFKRPNAMNSVVYSWLRPSKARRSFEYAQYLLEHDILTPFPIAYVEERTATGLKESFYICRHIDYDFTFRELIHDPMFENRKVILEQFTEFTFKMHENRVNFLDHSPGNTLIVNKGNGQYDFYLIDLNRMKFEDMDTEARMDNFKKLWPSRAMVKIMADKYAELSKQPAEKLYAILMEKTVAFKKKITKKKYLKRKLKGKKK
ncbi:lipopolysaccharide kinase InaA family protein [Flavobacterium beibuense]|uniref:lipopolysaccharide kinase InaA family protein n=1 Tax=Flavobacterium beibuense TaxID=657326 RepID=UPI003A8FC683